MDLCDPKAIENVIREVEPTIIVNPAAYTAVDRAEKERELATLINAQAPGVIARISNSM